ncbi:putative ribonuclease H-like domain-containing protein, partial [Tanacetum coccineum]
AGNQTNGIAGKRDNIVAGQAKKKIEPEQDYILIPFCTTDPLISQGSKDSEKDVGMKPTEVNESRASDKGEEDEQDTRSEFERLLPREKQTNNSNSFNTVGTPVSAVGPTFTNDDPSSPVNAAEASNTFEDHLFERFSPFKNAFALPHDFKLIQALEDPSWIEAMQEELLQFQLQKVWTLVNLSISKRAIGPKWVFRNKKDKRGIVVRNKARLVAQVLLKKRFMYVKPPGFEDPRSQTKFRRATIDKTFVHQKDKGGISLLGHVYALMYHFFGSTKKSLCDEVVKVDAQEISL